MPSSPLAPANLFALVRDAALAFGQDRAPRLAAALAYYAMLSLSPLLLLAAAVLGRYLSDPAILNGLFGVEGLVTQNLGQQAADFLKDQMPTQTTLFRGSTLATVVGLGTLFMGSTGLFVQLQDALNSMWGADPPPPQSVGQMVRSRLLALVLILLIGGVLLAFLVANTYLSAIAAQLGARLGAGALLVRTGTLLLSTLVLTLIFAFTYKFLPQIKLEWKETWIGAAITAFLFTVGQIAISLYLARTAPGSAFGASAALVALLVWVYFSGMIFFFGAEVTWVYSQKYGSHAGGAANTAKKQALAAQGAQISTEPSPQEQEAAAQAGQPVRDSRGRIIALPGLTPLKLPRVLPQVPTRAEGRTLPTVRATLWNAFTAVLAVPTVIVLRMLGLTGGRKRGS